MPQDPGRPAGIAAVTASIGVAALAAAVALGLDLTLGHAWTLAASAEAAPHAALGVESLLRFHALFQLTILAALAGLAAALLPSDLRGVAWATAAAALGVAAVWLLRGGADGPGGPAAVGVAALLFVLAQALRRPTARARRREPLALGILALLAFGLSLALPALLAAGVEQRAIPKLAAGNAIAEIGRAACASLMLLAAGLLAGGALLGALGPAPERAARGHRGWGLAVALAMAVAALPALGLVLRSAPTRVGEIVDLPLGGRAQLLYGPHHGLRTPDGLAFHPDRGLAVADELRHRVVVFPISGGVETWVSEADGLVSPEGLAWTPAGALYVSDDAGRRVLRADRPGAVRVVVGKGRLRSPEGLAFAGDGTLFVADEGTGRILRSTGGRRMSVFAERRDGLVAPEEMAFDARGRLVVSDDRGGRVLRFDPDGTAHVLERLSEVLGQPEAVTAAPDGRVYVSDFERGLVARVEDDGGFTIVARFRAPFQRLSGLAVGSDGELLVASSPHHIFAIALPETELVAFPEQGIHRILVTTVTERSARITWITERPEIDRVHAWSLDRKLVEVADAEPVRLHAVELEGLEPDAIHHFLVRGPSGASHLHHFRTLAPISGTPLFTMAVVADPQFDGVTSEGGRDFARAVEAINASGVDFVILPGDLIDGRNREEQIPDFTEDARGYAKAFLEFKQIADRLRMPYHAAPGDHEFLHTPGTQAAYLKIFGLKSPYYALDLHGARFLFLDCRFRAGWKPDGEQMKWLARELRAHRNQDVYVAIHFAVVEDPYVFEGERGLMPDVEALFAQHGRVRAVYNGHKNTLSATLRNGTLYVSVPQPTTPPKGYLIVRVYPVGLIQSFHEVPEGPPQLGGPRASGAPEIDPEDLRWDPLYRMGRPETRNFTWRFGAPSLSTGAR